MENTPMPSAYERKTRKSRENRFASTTTDVLATVGLERTALRGQTVPKNHHETHGTMFLTWFCFPQASSGLAKACKERVPPASIASSQLRISNNIKK